MTEVIQALEGNSGKKNIPSMPTVRIFAPSIQQDHFDILEKEDSQ